MKLKTMIGFINKEQADNLFYYFIIDKDNIPLDEIDDFKNGF